MILAIILDIALDIILDIILDMKLDTLVVQFRANGVGNTRTTNCISSLVAYHGTSAW